jgi:hypothetical protein
MIGNGALVMRAGIDGTVAPVSVAFPPSLFQLDEPDGGMSEGLALIAIETAPGRVPPSDYFSCTLMDADGADLLCGTGFARHPRRRSYSVIRDENGAHPVIRPNEKLQFEITGNTRPGAEVRIELSYVQLAPAAGDPADV